MAMVIPASAANTTVAPKRAHAGEHQRQRDRLQQTDVLVAAIADGGDYRMARAYFGMWEQPDTAHSMTSMLQSATSNPDAYQAFRDFMQRYVLTGVSALRPRSWVGESRPGYGRCSRRPTWSAPRCCATLCGCRRCPSCRWTSSSMWSARPCTAT